MSPIADFGTVQVYRDAPPASPFVCFAESLSLGADNFQAWLINRNNRRANRTSGVTETWKNISAGQHEAYDLEAFAPTRDELDEIVAEYLCRYPREQFETRFCRIRDEEFDGWSVRGERLRERRMA